MPKGIKDIRLRYPTKTFRDIEKEKEKKDLSWEDFFLWTVENSK